MANYLESPPAPILAYIPTLTSYIQNTMKS